MDDPVVQTILVGAGFLVGFPLLWGAIVLLLSYVGGWQRLAARYATDKPPRGKAFAWINGRVGFVNYNNCLNVHVSSEGLHLSTPWLFRFAHQPVLIPWRDVHSERPRRVFWFHSVRFEVGRPRVARLELPQKVFDARAAETPR